MQLDELGDLDETWFGPAVLDRGAFDEHRAWERRERLDDVILSEVERRLRAAKGLPRLDDGADQRDRSTT